MPSLLRFIESPATRSANLPPRAFSEGTGRYSKGCASELPVPGKPAEIEPYNGTST